MAISPKVPTRASLPRGAERIAAILNQPEIVFPDESSDGIKVEDVAQCVGNHDGSGLFAAGRFKLAYIDLVAGQGYIHEDRHQSILNDRIHGGRETGSDGDDFVAGLEPAVAKLWAR